MSDLTDVVADKEFRAQCERSFRSFPAATQRIISDATLKVTWAMSHQSSQKSRNLLKLWVRRMTNTQLFGEPSLRFTVRDC